MGGLHLTFPLLIMNIFIYKTTKRFIAGFIPVNSVQEPVSRVYRKLFRSKKPFVKIRPTYSVKLVFSYVVEGVKIEIYVTAKFRASRPFRVEDTKRIKSPEKTVVFLRNFANCLEWQLP